ncbi:MAG: hypothetical protein Q9165_007345 [Trypethelium subeluteriae]
MGWLPFSGGSSNQGPKPSSDGAFEAPGRDQRAHCWEARDEYFRCLDRHDIIDSIQDGKKAAAACGRETLAFEQNCATSWVKYFKQRRVADAKKAATLRQLEAEGAGPIPAAEMERNKRASVA